MASIYRNVSGEVTTQIVKEGANIVINKISFTNIHASTTCTLDLFAEKKYISASTGSGSKIYFLKSVALPVGATLIHSDISISTRVNQYSLFVKLTKGASETPTVDVIIS